MAKLGRRFKIRERESVKSFIHIGVYKGFYRPVFSSILETLPGLVLWQMNSESAVSHRS